MSAENIGFESKLIHAGKKKDPFGSAVGPVYQTSTFQFKNADHGAACFTGADDGYIYTRLGNPTIEELEDALAGLEGGAGGIGFSSGMGAVNTVYAALLGSGGHIVIHNAVYGPSRGVLESVYKRFGVEATYVNAEHAEEVEKAIRPNTRLIYLETPANPTIGITDLEAVSQIARNHNIPICVDNTFCSPYLQRPIEYGVDIVLHSLTKFINGHADVVGGALISREKEMHRLLKTTMTNLGSNMDPHQAWLVRRGMKTLAIRMEKAQENARQVAVFLENHPRVAWVKYPGLASHPQHELAKKQMYGPGAMMSFEVAGGLEAGKRMMDRVQLALLAVSLGGIETLIQHPASMTHSKLSKEAKLESGITDGLVRLSVGIENLEDIINDLDQALKEV